MNVILEIFDTFKKLHHIFRANIVHDLEDNLKLNLYLKILNIPMHSIIMLYHIYLVLLHNFETVKEYYLYINGDLYSKIKNNPMHSNLEPYHTFIKLGKIISIIEGFYVQLFFTI